MSRPVSTGRRRCRCGADISHRHHSARYCASCRVEVTRQQHARYARRRYSRDTDYREREKARLRAHRAALRRAALEAPRREPSPPPGMIQYGATLKPRRFLDLPGGAR